MATMVNREDSNTILVECEHCGCRFKLSLISCGDDYQNLLKKLNCPFCTELFPCDLGFETVKGA